MTDKQEVNIEELVESLSHLSVLKLSKLKKALEKEWDVKATAAAPMMVAPAEGSAGEAGEEATDFQVILEEFPADKKIAAIKIVREVTGLGLKEAKELVEGVPKVVKEAPKAEAEEIKKKLTDAAGAKVSLKGV